jgi:hypothetical protein
VYETPQLPFINSRSTANSTQFHKYTVTGPTVRDPTQLLTKVRKRLKIGKDNKKDGEAILFCP